MTKYILFTKLLIFILFISCVQVSKPNLNSIHTKCANDISLYTAISQNILYKDSLNKIYLKVNNVILDDLIEPLSDCQKLPFAFVDEVGLINDSIASIGQVIDVKSFTKIKNTNHYYRDKNRVYYFRTAPVTYPSFYEIEINQLEIRVIDSITISDESSIYHNGILKK
ncbi:MAG TPA: hypothetical protein VF677_15315 [Flavobacterium sp.]|jgi:hypothetical protein